jgi:hypothetical protein
MVISELDDEQSTGITTDDYWKKERCHLDIKAKDFTKATKDDLRRDLESIMNKTGPSVNTNPLTPPEVIGNPTGDGQICESASLVLIGPPPGRRGGETTASEPSSPDRPKHQWSGLGGICRLIFPHISVGTGLEKHSPTSNSENGSRGVEGSRNSLDKHNGVKEPTLGRTGDRGLRSRQQPTHDEKRKTINEKRKELRAYNDKTKTKVTDGLEIPYWDD